jgi:hypothetical protein
MDEPDTGQREEAIIELGTSIIHHPDEILELRNSLFRGDPLLWNGPPAAF